MNPTTFKGVSSANTNNAGAGAAANVMIMNRQNNCFLCDVRLQSAHIRDIDQLFYDPKLANSHHHPHLQQQQQQQSKSPLATILSEVLEQTIQETAVHSKYVCRKCQEQCRNYEILAAQLQQIRQNILNNYNETANKYHLKELHLDLVKQRYDTIEAINDGGSGGDGDGDGDDSNIQNMFTIESVDSAIGEVFEHENNIMSNSDLVGKSTTQMKKVMLIKATSKNGSNPFFTISHMDGSIDDDQTIHAVSQENPHSVRTTIIRIRKRRRKH